MADGQFSVEELDMLVVAVDSYRVTRASTASDAEYKRQWANLLAKLTAMTSAANPGVPVVDATE